MFMHTCLNSHVNGRNGVVLPHTIPNVVCVGRVFPAINLDFEDPLSQTCTRRNFNWTFEKKKRSIDGLMIFVLTLPQLFVNGSELQVLVFRLCCWGSTLPKHCKKQGNDFKCISMQAQIWPGCRNAWKFQWIHRGETVDILCTVIVVQRTRIRESQHFAMEMRKHSISKLRSKTSFSVFKIHSNDQYFQERMNSRRCFVFTIQFLIQVLVKFFCKLSFPEMFCACFAWICAHRDAENQTFLWTCPWVHQFQSKAPKMTLTQRSGYYKCTWPVSTHFGIWKEMATALLPGFSLFFTESLRNENIFCHDMDQSITLVSRHGVHKLEQFCQNWAQVIISMFTYKDSASSSWSCDLFLLDTGESSSGTRSPQKTLSSSAFDIVIRVSAKGSFFPFLRFLTRLPKTFSWFVSKTIRIDCSFLETVVDKTSAYLNSRHVFLKEVTVWQDAEPNQWSVTQDRTHHFEIRWGQDRLWQHLVELPGDPSSTPRHCTLITAHCLIRKGADVLIKCDEFLGAPTLPSFAFVKASTPVAQVVLVSENILFNKNMFHKYIYMYCRNLLKNFKTHVGLMKATFVSQTSIDRSLNSLFIWKLTQQSAFHWFWFPVEKQKRFLDPRGQSLSLYCCCCQFKNIDIENLLRIRIALFVGPPGLFEWCVQLIIVHWCSVTKTGAQLMISLLSGHQDISRTRVFESKYRCGFEFTRTPVDECASEFDRCWYQQDVNTEKYVQCTTNMCVLNEEVLSANSDWNSHLFTIKFPFWYFFGLRIVGIWIESWQHMEDRRTPERLVGVSWYFCKEETKILFDFHFQNSHDNWFSTLVHNFVFKKFHTNLFHLPPRNCMLNLLEIRKFLQSKWTTKIVHLIGIQLAHLGRVWNKVASFMMWLIVSKADTIGHASGSRGHNQTDRILAPQTCRFFTVCSTWDLQKWIRYVKSQHF